LIVGIGFYPKLATQTYDVTTVALNSQVRQSYSEIAQGNPALYAKGFSLPNKPEVGILAGIIK
jgi:NAD(P)H-quinone oxidoreductase subunit 4